MPHRVTHVKPVTGGVEHQVYDQWVDAASAHQVESVGSWKGRTVFVIHSSADLSAYQVHSEAEVCVVQWTPKQHRQLMTQIRQGNPQENQSEAHVVEVFSPPRFGLECEKLGYSCISADLCTHLSWPQLDHPGNLCRFLLRGHASSISQRSVATTRYIFASGWWFQSHFSLVK